MKPVKCKKKRVDAEIPRRMRPHDSGYDVFASVVLDKKTRKVISDLAEPMEVKPGEGVLFGIGVCLEIPDTHHAKVVSRSGLGAEYDIEAGYSGAPIDSNYRGEITVLLRNKKMAILRFLDLFRKQKRWSFMVSKNMRIAQLLFEKKETPEIIEVEELSKTERGDKGLGSTGL